MTAFCPCPLSHGQWEPIPELTDEFDGDTLDASKWHDHNPTWLGREPGFFSRDNVRVSDGKLQLHAKLEDLPGLPAGYHTFTTAAVQSKARILYGYIEAKCKPMDSRVSSAFWLYAQDPVPPAKGKTDWWTEIDIFEIAGRHPKWDAQVHMAAHIMVTPEHGDKHVAFGGKWVAPFRLADDYHTYGLEWDADELRYYVDGAVRHTLKNTYWRQPLHIDFNGETKENWFGLPEKDSLPAVFNIEYIRSWRRTDRP